MACLEFAVDELADELLEGGGGKVLALGLEFREVFAEHHSAKRGQLVLLDAEEVEDALVLFLVCVDVQTDHLHSTATRFFC